MAKKKQQREQGITVLQLAQECMRVIKAGMGNRHVMISNDDEGNGFHELFYGISPCKDAIGNDASMYPYGVTPEQADKEYIVLG